MTIRTPKLLGVAIAAGMGLAACDRPPPPVAPGTAETVPEADASSAQFMPPSPEEGSTSIADRAEQRGAADSSGWSDPGPAYAQVISVKPVRDQGTRTRQQCRDVAVTRRAPIKDENKVAGTAIGAVLGGVVGNQVGGGRGRDLATVAGVVGGGIAGRKIQENQQERRTVTQMEQRCETVKENVGDGDIVAYDIVYEYGGQTHKARIDHDPGDRIALPVRSID